MALKENYKTGDAFPPQDLNLICDTINNDSTSVSTVTTQAAATATGLNTTAAIDHDNQTKVSAIQSTQSTTQTALANLQTSMDSINSRLSVLEGVAPPPPAVPTAPTNVVIGAITATTIALSWTAPTGTAATSYVVRYTPTGTGAYINAVTVTAPTVTATITGLTQASGYDIVVRADNAAGPGGESPPRVNIRTLSPFTPSPAWTTIPTATQIIMDDGGVVTLVNGVVFLNGSPMGNTALVILVLKSDTGRIYQENSDPHWWYWDPTQLDPWVFTSDPRIVTPPSGGPTPPPPAQAAGYVIRTFGPATTIGTNWVSNNGTNVQNADGSVTTFGTDGNDDQLQTATMLGGGSWTGTAFGGGAYFEATIKWVGSATLSGGGSPAFYANDVEMQANPWGPAAHWPGQATGYDVWFQADVLVATNAGSYDSSFHNFYGPTGGPEVQGLVPSTFTFPSGFDTSVYHKYGLLWVPATPTKQGFVAVYLDGVEWRRVSWNFISGTISSPPVLSGGVISTGGFLDTRHLYLLLGSGPNNPMTVSSVEVWQVSASGNLVDGVPSSGGGGSGVPPTGVPPQASAAGYNLQTLGPALTLGTNWFRFEGAGGSGTITTNPDGSMHIIAPSGATDGHQIQSCVITSGFMGFTGKVFGGGGYFEAEIKWANDAAQAGLGAWPAWWANDIEMQTDPHGTNVQWPGQIAGYSYWYEVDFMEAFGPGSSGSQLHNWYSDTNGPRVSPVAGQFTYPAGFDPSQYHKYGFLWVPATSTSNGYGAFFTDGVEWTRITWNHTNPGTPPPHAPNWCGGMDARHLYLMIGTGIANPFDVRSASVWQKDESGNIVK